MRLSEEVSGLGKVHSTFRPFVVDKMSTKISWELNTMGPTLGLPVGRDIFCIASQAHDLKNRAGHCRPGSLMDCNAAGLVFLFIYGEKKRNY